MDLAGRVVVLTGASGGIGEALTRELVEAGACVVAVGRSGGRLRALAERHTIGSVVQVVADVSQPQGRDALLSRLQALPRPPSVLVIAHAQAAFGAFAAQDADAFESLVRANLLAPMHLVHALLPMLGRDGQGAVVAIGSTFGSLAFPGFAAYSATKFGLRGLVEALAREHAGGPVRFQYLSPRATRTPFNSPAVEALNRELKVAADDPSEVARQIRLDIERGTRRRQLGWPEKLFARLNGLLPALVDRSLRGQLPVVMRHAHPQRSHPSTLPEETRHDPVTTR